MPVYRLGAYFGLVAALTLPFWVLGAFVDVMLLPGLPIAALAVVCPSLAGAILIAHDGGASRLIAWLKEAASVRHAGRWLAVALVINPILFALAFVISRALGAQIPSPWIGPQGCLRFSYWALSSKSWAGQATL
jgi:hypothetical protein